jgi:hypothetical protein
MLVKRTKRFVKDQAAFSVSRSIRGLKYDGPHPEGDGEGEDHAPVYALDQSRYL